MDFKPYWKFLWMAMLGAIALISGMFSVLREIIAIYSGSPPVPSLFWSWARIAFFISASILWVAEYKARVKAEKLASDLARDKWKQEGAKATFATLMNEGQWLLGQLGNMKQQDSQDFRDWFKRWQEWKLGVPAALDAEGLHIESTAFSHSANNPSTAIIGNSAHFPSWSKLYAAQLVLQNAKLQEIVERKLS